MSAITITDAAHDYLADLLSKQNTPGIGIRIFITQPGTQYAETCIAYCKPGEEKPDDEPVGLKSFTAYLDAVSVPFLEDALVDYATDRMGGQLTIKRLTPRCRWSTKTARSTSASTTTCRPRSTQVWPATAAR